MGALAPEIACVVSACPVLWIGRRGSGADGGSPSPRDRTPPGSGPGSPGRTFAGIFRTFCFYSLNGRKSPESNTVLKLHCGDKYA